MDKKIMKNVSWCKEWTLPKLSVEETELLNHCVEVSFTEPSYDVNEIMKKSDEFPGTFPLESNRLKTLIKRKPKELLEKYISSTYPLIHERVLLLMAQFIVHKRNYGSSIEKDFYKNMTIPQLIDRLLKKRALNFMTNKDKYMLLDGKKGAGGWESIGTPDQKKPLLLENCLSYDEIKLSAMLYVSSYTVCINDGTRKNHGVVNGDVQQEAVIIGVIGPRFQRDRMDCEDILITPEKNTKSNDDGDSSDSRNMWRKLWADFYQIQSYTYEKAKSIIDKPSNKKMKKDQKQFTDRFVIVGKEKTTIFDNEAYYKRISIIAECSLFEAEKRASEAGKECYLNVIGCGLGVWKISSHQNDVYILTFIERVRAMLRDERLPTLTHINFAYINISKTLRYSLLPSGDTKMFIKHEGHPKGGIWLLFENREPSSRLTGELSDKLLVMTYAWDGNAQPGNEYWIGKTGSSGDSAAASSTQISELHNVYINPAVTAGNTRVVRGDGIVTIQEYCRNIDQ